MGQRMEERRINVGVGSGPAAVGTPQEPGPEFDFGELRTHKSSDGTRFPQNLRPVDPRDYPYPPNVYPSEQTVKYVTLSEAKGRGRGGGGSSSMMLLCILFLLLLAAGGAVTVVVLWQNGVIFAGDDDSSDSKNDAANNGDAVAASDVKVLDPYVNDGFTTITLSDLQLKHQQIAIANAEANSMLSIKEAQKRTLAAYDTMLTKGLTEADIADAIILASSRSTAEQVDPVAIAAAQEDAVALCAAAVVAAGIPTGTTDTGTGTDTGTDTGTGTSSLSPPPPSPPPPSPPPPVTTYFLPTNNDCWHRPSAGASCENKKSSESVNMCQPSESIPHPFPCFVCGSRGGSLFYAKTADWWRTGMVNNPCYPSQTACEAQGEVGGDSATNVVLSPQDRMAAGCGA